MKPICVKCQRFYRPHRNGRRFVEAMPAAGSGTPLPGRAAPHHWKPYKVWVGDEWLCLGCGHLLIVGVAHSPVREHYQDGFAEALASADYLQVNDC